MDEDVFIEVFSGPVLAITDGKRSGAELAGTHRHEWGTLLHSFKITESAARDIVATLQWTFPSVNCARSDRPGPIKS